VVDLSTFDWGAVIQFATALATLVTAIIAWKTRVTVKAMTEHVTAVTTETQKQIVMLEQNTNSIKDALVASTASASRAEGLAAGQAQGQATEDILRARLETRTPVVTTEKRP